MDVRWTLLWHFVSAFRASNEVFGQQKIAKYRSPSKVEYALVKDVQFSLYQNF